MRVLVCGGRNYSDEEEMFSYLDNLNAQTPISVIIEGEMRGADKLSRRWAESRGVGVEPYPADWDRYGNAAGPRRNQQMLDEGHPDKVVAFRGGTGTADMTRRAIAAGVKVEEVG